MSDTSESLKSVHYKRLRFIFKHGRPIYVASLTTVDLDLIAAGLVEKIVSEGRLSDSLRIRLLPDGEKALKDRLESVRSVCDIHHSLGSRLAHWLREAKGCMTWENIAFSNGELRTYADDEWTEVRLDVVSCALTPTARLAKVEAFEVRVSMADFKADLANARKVRASRDIAEAAWYCTPAGLVQPEQLPAGFGLIWESVPGKFEVIKRPKRKKGFLPHQDTLMTLVRRRAMLPEVEVL